MTYSEWKDWQQLPITQMFYSAVHERIKDATDVLSYSAGLDPAQDNFYRGFIHAYKEMLDFKVESSEDD